MDKTAPSSIQTTIEEKLRAGLQPALLEVTNDSQRHADHASSPRTGQSHFRVRVVAEAFRGLSLVAQHRLVYGLLAEELRRGVHALALETSVPDGSPGA